MNTATASAPETLWEQVSHDFREACLLRRQGRQAEADRILNRTLPPTIAQWSATDPRPADTKKTELLRMFADEQQRVDAALVVQRLVSERLTAELVPSLCAAVADQVRGVVEEQVTRLGNAVAERGFAPASLPMVARSQRQRVRFDDIVGVIDAVLEEQRSDYGPGLSLSGVA